MNMASGQTEHYSLNQWQPEDKVLREEFNQDNAKIETTIADVEEHCKLIKVTELVLAESGSQANLSLSTVDMNQFSMLKVIINSKTSAEGMKMRFNNMTTNIYYSSNDTASNLQDSIMISPICSGGLCAVVQIVPLNLWEGTGVLVHSVGQYPMLISYTGSGSCTSVLFSSLTSIQFLAEMDGYFVKQGSRFDVYGLLK